LITDKVQAEHNHPFESIGGVERILNINVGFSEQVHTAGVEAAIFIIFDGSSHPCLIQAGTLSNGLGRY